MGGAGGCTIKRKPSADPHAWVQVAAELGRLYRQARRGIKSAQHQQTDGEEDHRPDVFDLDVFQRPLDLVARNSVRWASVSVCPDRKADHVGVNTRLGRSRWVGRSNRSSTPGHSRSRKSDARHRD